MRKLSEYKFNDYSLAGEDGIIEEIIRRLSSSEIELNKWCCEFGAWDGLYLSNCARLIKKFDWSAVMIEGDSKRVKDLQKNFPSSKVVKICSFVLPTGANSLDNILGNTDIPVDFDLLSIDIDGMDYYIFESLQKFKPKVVCIEFNPSIPNSIFFVQENNSRVKHGSSAASITSLAEKKGYTLVCATDQNLFLMRNDLVRYVVENAESLSEIRPQGETGQYIFSGYDGTLLSNQEHITLGWHGSMPIASFQPLPMYLRRYSGDYNLGQKFALKLLLSWKKLRAKNVRDIRSVFRRHRVNLLE